MACSKCGGNRAGFEVVAANGNVVYSSTSEATALAVSKRYPGSEVRNKGAARPATPATPAPKAMKDDDTVQ